MTRYVNTKTGAVLDSSFKVSGGDWVEEKSQQSIMGKEKPAIVEPDNIEPNEEPKETSSENMEDFDGITRAQIMQELDAFGVQYDKRANKQTLYDLMMSQGK